MKTDVIKFVEFGQGGDVAHIANHCRISGYGNPDNPHAAKPSEKRIIPDGTFALDKREAIDTKEGFAWVFKGPMVDVDLSDDEVDRCPEPSALFASAVADNAFGKLLTLQKAYATENEAGPLDSVSIGRYIAGWLKVGAKLGVYKDSQIVWSE